MLRLLCPRLNLAVRFGTWFKFCSSRTRLVGGYLSAREIFAGVQRADLMPPAFELRA